MAVEPAEVDGPYVADQVMCLSCSGRSTECESVSAGELAAVWKVAHPPAWRLVDGYIRRGTMPDPVRMFRCERCALVFANPTFAGEADWYEMAERYGDRWEYGRTLADLRGSGLEVLDVGCGEGHFLDRANRAGHRATGIDFNGSAVAAAAGRGLDARVSDLRALGRGRSFDAITFFHVIEHLEAPNAFFDDLAAVARPAATLHFSCPGPRRFTTPCFPEDRVGAAEMFDYPPLHQTRWNERAAATLLDRHGWRLVKFAEEPYHWRGVAVMLVSRRLARQGRALADVPPWGRKLMIARAMLGTAINPTRYRGMSMYCMAERTTRTASGSAAAAAGTG